jgi:hypothetical protein
MLSFVFRKTIIFLALVQGLFFLAIHAAYAQPEPMKFGKIEMKEMEMKSYDKDTSASAVVLGDYGRSYYTYVGEEFQVNLERHVRIKILKKSGYEHGNIRVPLWKSGLTEEKLADIKGFTYNLENGKIVKAKLEKEAIFQEKMNENLNVKTFAMPAIKEGSVIEYTYTIKSEFYYILPEWEFQRDIPVLWSEYRATVPEFFIFKQYSQGYEPYHIQTQEEGRESFAVRYAAEDHRGNGFNSGGRTPGGIENVEAKTTKYRWVMKDVPALEEEPYITTIKDYVAKVEFEITGTKFGAVPKSFRTTWEELAKSLMESESWGRQLNRTGFVKDEIQGLKAKYTDPAERAAAICAFVKKTMKWDGNERLYPESTLKKAYENRSGNSADINLLMLAMLKEADIDASPVILSTRSHGRAPFFPLVSKYNYVIALVKIGEKKLLMDATEPYASVDLLPLRCLNGEGRLIGPVAEMVSLHNKENYSSFYSAKLTLDSKGQMDGIVEESHSGYYGLSKRKELAKEGKDKYLEALKKKQVGWDMLNYEFDSKDNNTESVKATCKVSIGEHTQLAASLIYLNPILCLKEKENPFKMENRKFPVDFAAPIEETYVLTLTLPDGYEVDELPKPTIIALPEGGGKFTYNIGVNGNTLQVVSKVNIKKTVFVGDEYQYLREFYNHIVTKHAEQVVLKKKG